MKALERFTKTDLRNAGKSFNFAKKCEAVLNEVVSDIEPAFRKIFRVRTGFTRGHFSPTYNSAYSSTRKFSYGVARRLDLFLDPWEGELGFGVSAAVSRKDMYRVNRQLDWEEHLSDVYSWHKVKSNIQPAALAKIALQDMHALKFALDRA